MQPPPSSPGAGPVPMAVFNPRGFFQEYLSRLRTSLSPQQWDEFCSLRTSKDRVAFVGRLPGSADPQWPVDLSRGMKDAATAKAFKDRGNQAFLKGDFKAALDLYTRCVLLTPYGDDLGTAEIAVATANRSAALYRLGKYRKALEDIECALSMDFPKGLKHKVLDRKARCLLALSDRRKHNPEASRKARDGAMAALRETLTALDEATDLDAERRGVRETDVRMMLCVLTKAAEESANAGRTAKAGPPRQQQSRQQPPPVPIDVEEEDDDEAGCGGHAGQLPNPSGGRHPLYPGASQLISFGRRGAVGRQAEAKAPVAPGDILVSEKPWASVLLREKASTHCYQCFKPLLAPLPCPTCTTVAFCSSSCREAAVASHHATECPALALIWDSGVSLTCHLALRLISQRDIQFLRDLRPHIEDAKQAVASAEGKNFPGEGGSPAEEKLFWASELSAAQREYLSVLRLVTHEAERSMEDRFQRAVMATFLVKCLREWTEFFEEEQTDDDTTNGDALNDDDILVGDLLMHHLQMMQFNAHEVFEVEMGGQSSSVDTRGGTGAAGESEEAMITGEEDTGPWRSIGLGGAIYPSLALFNHSCEPGVVRYFKGNSVIVRAIRGANVGDVIAENYGPIYTRQPRDRRQAHLRTQYWFDCACRPCRENWPLFEDMPTTASGSLRFRCHPTAAPAPPKGPVAATPGAKGPQPQGQQTQVAKRHGCATGFVVVHTDSMAPVMNCNECGSTINVIKGLKMLSETDETYSKAEERLKALMSAEMPSGVAQKQWRAKVCAALNDFLKVLRSLEEVLAPPLRDFALCQQSVRRCMLALGNVRLCSSPVEVPSPSASVAPAAPNGVPS